MFHHCKTAKISNSSEMPCFRQWQKFARSFFGEIGDVNFATAQIWTSCFSVTLCCEAAGTISARSETNKIQLLRLMKGRFWLQNEDVLKVFNLDCAWFFFWLQNEGCSEAAGSISASERQITPTAWDCSYVASAYKKMVQSRRDWRQTKIQLLRLLLGRLATGRRCSEDWTSSSILAKIADWQKSNCSNCC